MKLISALVCSFLITGCNLSPKYERPNVIENDKLGMLTVHENLSGKMNIDDLDVHSFVKNSELQDLINVALEHNQDIQQAIANVQEARASYGMAFADLFPQISSDTSFKRQRMSENDTGMGTALFQNSASSGLSVNQFELDLWGRLRNIKDNAEYQLLSTDENFKSIKIRLITEVMSAYLDVVAERKMIQHHQRMLNLAIQSKDIIQHRVKYGESSRLEIHQTQSLILNAQISLETSNQSLQSSIFRLCTLIGTELDIDNIGKDLAMDDLFLRASHKKISPSILLNRPDILSVEAKLKAANANIGAARTAFLPTISLTGSIGFTAEEFNDLGKKSGYSWLFNPTVHIPILTMGKNISRLKMSEAQYRGLLAEYQKTIQHSWYEIRDNLSKYEYLSKQLTYSSQLVDSENERLRLSRELLNLGEYNHIEFIDSWRDLGNAEATNIKTKHNFILNEIDLFKNLGGKLWDNSIALK